MDQDNRDSRLAELQARIDTLLSQAKQNEVIQQRCHQQELALIATNGLEEYLQQLLGMMPGTFDLDALSLHVCDADHSIRHLISAEGLSPPGPGTLSFHDNERCSGAIGRQPLLQSYDPARHGDLFSAKAPPLASIAMLPLWRGDHLLGQLNLGSGDPQRFTPERATDFLQHQGAITAVCLENAINHERLRFLGLTDPLTGVRNRRYFEQRLQEECHKVQRDKQPLACLFLDLDHFKRINDQYGHHNGDRVLQQAAAAIREQLREGDLLSRYGGEEFVALLPATDSATALEIAERIRFAVEQRPMAMADGGSHNVTLSVGVAVLENTSGGLAEQLARRLVEAADAALYRAKDEGRNRVVADEG